MKVLLLIGCALCCCLLHAQEPVLKKNYFLKATIWETNRTVHHSYVADVTDTALLLTASPVTFRQSLLSPTMLNYQQVGEIELMRRGNVGRGLWKGIVIGTVSGGVVGAVTYRKCNDCWFDFGVGANIAAGAILGAAVGAVVGTISGALSRKFFVINGSKDKFDQMKLSVLDMAYRKSN